jgi:hypothetical protein
MSETEMLESLKLLPREKQAEVFDFVEYLVRRFGRREETAWTHTGFAEFALIQAGRGMDEDTVSYSSDDIRSPWR